ncbi:MAG TPA: hypothetical protein PKH53_03120 [Candidatus Saccharicenans sp.]|nr:hypothetical protein [Candidatus Saccharicenans sp.]
MKKNIGMVLLFLALLFVFTSEAWSIPAFARKYSISCKVCHNPFPKLKPYGEEFAGHGYVIKDQETPRYNIDTGDNMLSLLRELPIAIRFDGYLSFDNAHNQRFDFSAPFVIKLMSGGEISKNISYYLYFIFTEGGEIAGLEDAFIMFNNLFKTDLDLYVGQFQVSDPLFKRELRLTYEDYRIYGVKVGQARADLTYDRGVMLTYGLPTGTDLTLEIVNGMGLDPVDDFETFDADKYKNFLVRISQNFSPELRAGAFGYFGKERQNNANDSLWMAGGDLTWSQPKVEFNVQYLFREDKNPYFLMAEPEKIQTQGGFAELLYFPHGDDSRWYTAAIFNWVDSDQPDLKYTSAGLHYGYLLRRNVRATVEATYVFKSELPKHLRLGLGLITGF